MIRFLRDSELQTLKHSVGRQLAHYKADSASWALDYLGITELQASAWDLEPPDLLLGNSSEIDLENVKRLYGAWMDLPPSVAATEGLWAGQCFGPYWQYVQQRWKLDTVSAVTAHVFYGPRRPVVRNAIARLWWIGKLTHDAGNQYPWKLTEFVMTGGPDLVSVLLERNTSNSTSLLREQVEGLEVARDAGVKLTSNVVRDAAKHVNVLGSVYVLDAMEPGALGAAVSDYLETKYLN